MNQDIMVSVLVFSYNHSKHIKRCLDSIINQDTNFEFEVLVHDDCSTDGTTEILKKYEKEHLGKIWVMYETDNQWSKGTNIFELLNVHVKGKYVAMCDGDDFWLSRHKLQKQFICMESRPNASMCVHNTLIHDLLGKSRDYCFNYWKKNKVLTEEDVFFGWNIHLSSYFIRVPFQKRYFEFSDFWFGDYIMLTYCFAKGQILYLPDVMSVYNSNNVSGFTYNNTVDLDTTKSKEGERIKYLLKFDKFTKGHFHEIVCARISSIKLYLFMLEVINKNTEQGKNDIIRILKKWGICIKYICCMLRYRGVIFWFKILRNRCSQKFIVNFDRLINKVRRH